MAVAAMLFVHRLETGGDNLDYLLFARSLQHGDWPVIAHWRFPPAYPMFLAAFLRATGHVLPQGLFTVSSATIYAAKLSSLVWLLVSLLSVYAWARIYLDRRDAGLLVLLYGLNQNTLGSATSIGTEMPYIALSFLSLACIERALQPEKSGLGRLFFGSLCGVTAVLTRGVGLALALALMLRGVEGIWRRRTLSWTTAAMLTMPSVAHVVLNLTTGARQNMAQATWNAIPTVAGHDTLWEKIVSNLSFYARGIIDMLAPKVLGERGALSLLGLETLSLAWIAGGALLLLLCSCQVLRRTGLPLPILYMGAYTVILLLWPHQDGRFLLPLLPFMIWLLLDGLRFSTQAHEKAKYLSRAALWSLAVWLLTTDVYAGVKNVRQVVALWGTPAWNPERYRITSETDYAEFVRAGIWISSNLPPNAVVYSRKATAMQVFSQRQGRHYLNASDAADLWSEMQSERAPVYLVCDVFDARTSFGYPRLRYMDPLLKEHSERLRLMHETPGGCRVYQICPAPCGEK
jgi:hypothetical protein